MTLYSSVLSGLAELEPLDARDQAVADLALLYARGIDDSGEWADKQRDPLAELGPKLLACLVQLQMTPGAREKVKADLGDQGGKVNPLDELRARRRERGA